MIKVDLIVKNIDVIDNYIPEKYTKQELEKLIIS